MKVFENFQNLINDNSLWSPKWIISSLLIGLFFSFSKRKHFISYIKDSTFKKEIYLDIKWILIGVISMTALTLLLGSIFKRSSILSPIDVRIFLESFIQKQIGNFRIELDPFWGELFAVFIFFLAWDFAFFTAHYAFHQWPFLWRFHKIHHSAKKLSPLTRLRVHPVEIVITGLFVAIIVGSCKAIIFKVFWIENPIYFFTVDFFYIVYLLTAHLRHSNIPLGFGPILSYIFSSPVMHQIHHSTNPRHNNKNFGISLSVWDYMLGTLYIPPKNESEKLEFGLIEQNQNSASTIEETAFAKME